jgi:hypothetical protein
MTIDKNQDLERQTALQKDEDGIQHADIDHFVRLSEGVSPSRIQAEVIPLEKRDADGESSSEKGMAIKMQTTELDVGDDKLASMEKNASLTLDTKTQIKACYANSFGLTILMGAIALLMTGLNVLFLVKLAQSGSE